MEDADIHHAPRNLLRTIPSEDLTMFIGTARNGAVLEIGAVEDDAEDRVIHAMPARRKFWPSPLREERRSWR